MKVKLLRELLVGPSDVMAMRAGTEHEMDDARARELVKLGLVEEVGGGTKAAPAHENKMAAAPENKAEPTPTSAPAKTPKTTR